MTTTPPSLPTPLDAQLGSILARVEHLSYLDLHGQSGIEQALDHSRRVLGALAQYRHILQTALKAAAVVLVFLSCAVARQAHAQVTSAAVFLKIEPDSRAAAMGSAGVALADGASAQFWNPAGLAFQRGTEIAITHSNWLPEFQAGLFYEYLVAKHHVPGWGTIGAHTTYLFLGEQESRDAQNNLTGQFRAYDLAVGLSYGFQVSERFALGTGLRLIYSNLGSGQRVGAQQTRAGLAVGFDLGGLYRSSAFDLGGVSTSVSVGFNLANMGPKIQYSDRLLLRASAQRQPSLSDVRCGGALQPRGGGLLVRLRFGGGLAALEHDALLVAAHPRPLRVGPPRDTPPKPIFLGAFQGFDTNG